MAHAALATLHDIKREASSAIDRHKSNHNRSVAPMGNTHCPQHAHLQGLRSGCIGRAHRSTVHEGGDGGLLRLEQRYVLLFLLRGRVDQVGACDVGAVHAVARAQRRDDDAIVQRAVVALRRYLGKGDAWCFDKARQRCKGSSTN